MRSQPHLPLGCKEHMNTVTWVLWNLRVLGVKVGIWVEATARLEILEAGEVTCHVLGAICNIWASLWA